MEPVLVPENSHTRAKTTKHIIMWHANQLHGVMGHEPYSKGYRMQPISAQKRRSWNIGCCVRKRFTKCIHAAFKTMAGKIQSKKAVAHDRETAQ